MQYYDFNLGNHLADLNTNLGVGVHPIFLILIAFTISFFTSQGGISGAFLILPFQVSFLGFTSPSVSSTNLVYNIVAIPSGVYRYIREGRMQWSITTVTILGTLPGVLIGALIRIIYLPDPRLFKIFVGFVLLYIGIRLLYEVIKGDKKRSIDEKFKKRVEEISSDSKERGIKKLKAGLPPEAKIKTIDFSLKEIEYEFWGEKFRVNTIALFSLSFVVGMIGGTYGIGGGAIIAPFLIAVFGLPTYTIAGAALMGTFITSVVGVIYYTGLEYPPNWILGILFGIGGFIGMYAGARFQKYMPEKTIRLILSVLIISLALRYVIWNISG